MPKGIYKRNKPAWNKGRNCKMYNFGRKTGYIMSKKQKDKIGNGMKVAHKSGKMNESYKKISKSLKGRTISVDTRLKISNTLSRGLKKLNVLNCNLRKIPEYKKWSKDILIRDNYTCQKCGQVGGKLVAHHKVSFMEIIRKYNINNLLDALDCKELWKLSNGKTLCEKCHYLTDNYGSKNHFVKAKKI